MTPEILAQTHAAAFADTRAWSAAEFATLLAQPGVILCGDARSFALARLVLDEAELLTLATHPDFRRQGRAETVLAMLHADLQAAQAATLFLEVAQDNHAAKALYFKAGFAEIGRREGYYSRLGGAKIDALVLQKELSPTISPS